MARPPDLPGTAPVLGANPEAAWAYLAGGNLRVGAGQLDRAAGDFARAAALGAGPTAWYLLALVRLVNKDLAGYRESCAGALDRFAGAEVIEGAELALWGCVLGLGAVADYPALVRWAETRAASQPNSFNGLNTLGAVYFRAGRFNEAARAPEKAQAAYDPADELHQTIAYTFCFLAMAHDRSGNGGEARRWLAKALQRPGPDRVAGPGAPPVPWNRRLTLEVLRREAEALVNEAPRSRPEPE